MAVLLTLTMISALLSTYTSATPLRGREAPSEAVALQRLRSGISVLRQISESLYETLYDERIQRPVNTTCKLLSQLEGLEQLDSIDDDVFAMRVFTEANMKDSCQWVLGKY